MYAHLHFTVLLIKMMHLSIIAKEPSSPVAPSYIPYQHVILPVALAILLLSVATDRINVKAPRSCILKTMRVSGPLFSATSWESSLNPNTTTEIKV